MNTRSIFFATVIFLMSACSKQTGTDAENPVEGVNGYSFIAVTENETPAPKTTVGANDDGKPQTFWEDGDCITVYSDADVASGYTFSTELEQDTATATFTYDENFIAGNNYMAIYPSGTYRFDFSTGGGNAPTISDIEIPSVQTLVAGSFDRQAAVSTAYTTDGTTLPFKNATSLVKFKVADDRVVSGRVETSAGEYVSGTFNAMLNVSEEGKPSLTCPASGKNTVDFTVDGSTPLSTDTDYYVSVAPVASLAEGFSVSLQNAGGSYVKKTYEVGSIDRNKVYNIGDATGTNNVSKIVLNFNFSDEGAMTDWPTAAATEATTKIFTLNGVGYEFILTHANGAPNIQYLGVPSSGDKCLVIPGVSQLGLPVIPSYRLSVVSLTAVAGSLKSNSAGITSSICEIGNFEANVEGGATQPSATPVWTLSDTSPDVVYYLYQSGASSKTKYIKDLTLTYEKVSE